VAGIELGTAYISLIGETSKLKKDINAAFNEADRASVRTGKAISSNLGAGFSGASSSAAKAGKDAADAYQKSLQAQIRGAQIGEKIGSVLGKGIGLAIKGGIGVAAVGATAAVAGLTAALTKGFARLKNIDNAKFKLQALGNSAADVNEIMKSALASVKGTAFGLDQAASTAATAVAAGVPKGQGLTEYLTNVADAAAIAQTSMDEMGSIFNKVQTNGKAMTDDLQMLADRGLPIFTWLQKQYGVTGEALQKMVEDGKVSSADFNRAIHDNIGGAALKMGQSFQGAMDNMNAALGRLGAGLLAPGFDNAAGGISGITTALDSLNGWLSAHKQGVISFWEDIGQAAIYTTGVIMDFASGSLRAFGLWVNGMSQPMKLSLNLFGDWAKGMGKIIAAIPGMENVGANLHAAGIYTQTYADVLGVVDDGASQLADQIDRVSDSVAKNHDKLAAWADKGRAAATVTDALGDSFIKVNDNGHIEVQSNAMDKVAELNDLGLVVKNLPDGSFEVIAGTPEAQALIDAFVSKNSTLPPAKLPVDVDTSAAAAKLQALYTDIFKAPSGYSPPVAGGGNPLLAGPNAANGAAGYVPYDPGRLAQRPSFGGGRATGGAIHGPGTGTSDDIPTWLSNGEHVLTADDVSAMGGQDGVYAFRNALHRADGGAVGAIDAAYGNSGKPYQYGPWDCSMYMSYAYAGMAGLPPGRYFSTESDFEALGFKKGYKPGALNIGIRRGGGGPNSHMAGTLPNGVNVENSGSGGSMYGGNAKGANDFPTQYYYDGPMSGDMGALQDQSMQNKAGGSGGSSSNAGAAQLGGGAGVDPASQDQIGDPTAGRTEGYIPAAAGNSAPSGGSFASGLLDMGAEAINGLIDQAASAASMAAQAGLAAGTMGGSLAAGPAAGDAASFLIGMGANAAKRGVSYGFDMAGIGIDAAAEILSPFGVPRYFSTDPTQFIPNMSAGPTAAATTTGEQVSNGIDPNAAPGPSAPQPVRPQAHLQAPADEALTAVPQNQGPLIGTAVVGDYEELHRTATKMQNRKALQYTGRP
jgi:tape measure domain-containing protein